MTLTFRRLHASPCRPRQPAQRDAAGVRFLNVLPIPAAAGSADRGSITSWTRLEPQPRTPTWAHSVGARLFDPLWMMARQWQMGEFQGEDAGTPVQARVRATSALLSRVHLGELTANTNMQPPRYDPMHDAAGGAGRAPPRCAPAVRTTRAC